MSDNQKTPRNPIFQKRLPGGISAAIFEHVRNGKTYRSINVQRSYKSGNGWNRSSIYLDYENIPFTIEALNAALRFLNDFPVKSIEMDEATDGAVTDDSQAVA